MKKGRINWNLIIVLFIAVIAVAITSFALRKYHRNQRAKIGLTEGLSAYESGQWRQAANYLGQYLVVNPGNTDILIKYAESQMQIQPFKRDYLEQAINAYRIVLRSENNSQAANKLVQIYLQFGMPAEAEMITRRFLEDDSDGKFHQNLGISLVRQRKYEQAFDVLKELVERDPKQVISYNFLGEITEKRPDLSSLTPEQWYDKGVENNPDSAQAYIIRSRYRTDQEQFEAAFKDLEKAEECDLTDVNTRLSVAASWLRQREFERAQIHLETVRSADPSNESLWQMQAALAGQIGDTEQMISIADQGIEALGAENYSFLPLATELYLQAGQIEKAETCISRLKDADAERMTILYLEGLVAKSKAEWAKAIQKWQQAIQLGYSTEMVYLNLADTLDQINNRSMAIQLLRRYVSQYEGAYRGHLQLGRLFAQDLNWRDALDHATAATQLNPVSLDARILYWRSRIELLDTTKQVDVVVIREAIERLIGVNDNYATRMLMFNLAIRLNDYPLADEVLTNIENKFGISQALVLVQAKLLMLQDQYTPAIELLKQARQQYPKSDEILQLLVWGYSHNKEYETGVTLLKDALETSKDVLRQRRYRLWLAEVFTMSGQKNRETDVYLQMAEDNDSDIYARRQLLSLKQNTDSKAQLQQWIDQIKSAEGQSGWQWKYEQSRLWFYREEDFKRFYPEIVKLLNENLSINAEDQESRILLAASHERAGNVQLALSMYQDATPRQLENIEFIVAAVGAMYRAQEFRQAQALLTRAAESGVWDHRLARYELQNSLRVGKEDSAIVLLERIVAESPDDQDAKLSLAILQIRNGQFQEAENNLKAVLSNQPDSIAATAAMAEFYITQNQPNEALKLCDQYLSTYDNLQAHVMRCHVLLAMGNAAGCREGIHLIESRYSNDPEALVAVSRLYQMVGQTNRSIEVLNELLDSSEDDFSVQKQAAIIFLEQSSDMSLRQKGAELLDKALLQNPSDVKLRLCKARYLIQQRNAVSLKEATDISNRLVAEYPKVETAWMLLGQIALIQNNERLALDYAKQGLEHLPESKPLLLLKAQAQSVRSPAVAIDSLLLLQKQYPDDIAVITLLSQNYRGLKKYAEALELLNKSLMLDAIKESPIIQNEKIMVLYMTGDKENAELLYHKLIQQTDDRIVLNTWLTLLAQESEPAKLKAAYEEWSALYPESVQDALASSLGIILKMDHPDSVKTAQTIVNEMLQAYPESPVGPYAMAMLLHMTGKKIDAIPWYEKTLELNPKQIVAINNLAWILCSEKEDPQKALEYAEKGLAMNPNYVDLIDTRGAILMHLGEYEKAITDLKKCSEIYLESNANLTVTVFNLGSCLLETGQDVQALSELIRAKDIDAVNHGLSEQQRKELDVLIQRASQKI